MFYSVCLRTLDNCPLSPAAAAAIDQHLPAEPTAANPARFAAMTGTDRQTDGHRTVS